MFFPLSYTIFNKSNILFCHEKENELEWLPLADMSAQKIVM